MLLRRAAGGDVEELPSGSLPLGSGLVSEFTEHRTAFSPDDVFLLHTDGIYETADAAGESYGLSRLGRALRSAGGEAEQIRDAILADVAVFRGDAAQNDDISLVVVKIL